MPKIEKDTTKWVRGQKQSERSKSEFNDLLGLLFKQMRLETVEYLWDYVDSEDLDKKTSELIVARLEDFFNKKIYNIERKLKV